ncbi:MAG: T9SS type A sorting domain-containing protein [Desulfobulbaceae bacterium]|nr:T9SS type A sorting domain-containing protein [Candidatus Kapabacteria bacterium]MBS3998860.1 T9SS type A sorting domain-containing protein [Desulfobulbaceae bacterium]
MKTALLSIMLIFLITHNIFSQCADENTLYSFTFDGKSYEIVLKAMTWADAVDCSVERGGYLTIINSSEEQNALFDAIVNGAKIPWNYTQLLTGGGIGYVWIGATDQNEEGKWIWDGKNEGMGIQFWSGEGTSGKGDGNAVDNAYHNWGGKSTGTIKEPDNYGGSQHYAGLALAGWPLGTTMLGISGEWNDLSGSSQLYFIIEFDETSHINHEFDAIYAKIHPNPSMGAIAISTDISSYQVRVMNLNGQTIYSRNHNTSTANIDLKGFPNGVYLVHISDGKRGSIIKLILDK